MVLSGLIAIVIVAALWSLALRVVRGLVLEGSLEIGVVIAFLFYVQRFFDPIRSLTMQYSVMQRAMASGQRIFEVTDVGLALFRELADADDDTSFRILARALLEDERDLVLEPLMGNLPGVDRAMAATLRHARMVAHELRNALLTVEGASLTLTNALREAVASPPWRRITSSRLMLRPSCPYGEVEPTPQSASVRNSFW